MNIQFKADIPSTCTTMTMTMMHDQLNRPYLYVANKEGGLKIYDISNLTSPLLVQTIPVSSMGSLEVMNLSQEGNYLYLAIGNYFSAQKSGMAIVDVTNPVSASVSDYWEFTGPLSGSGIVKTEGNFAFLGAMGNGLIILDITTKSDILFVSQFLPDLYFPDPNPDPAKYNARGMEVRNDVVYLCFDAGGIRIINVTNKNTPFETGKYSNPVMNGLPRAYNNIAIDDSLAYVAVDYCGMEIINISDTGNMSLTGWWNPYNCPGNNWFSSPVHSNEIHLNKACKQLFISTGKSDLHVVDVSNPSFPDSCNYYGGVSNNTGTWGVGLYEDQIYLSYICNPLPFPFPSSLTRTTILTYTLCNTGIEENNNAGISIFPNPVNENLLISIDNIFLNNAKIKILDLSGRKVYNTETKIQDDKVTLYIPELKAGCYILEFSAENNKYYKKILKLNH